MEKKDLNMALGLAVEEKQFSFVEKLLEVGADVNCIYNEKPLLQTAIEQIEDDVFDITVKKMLLQHPGADIHVTNSEKETLLHIAVQSSDLRCTEFLLKNNVDLIAKNKKGQSILFYAAWYDSLGPEILLLLLKRGFYNINEFDLHGNTILHGLHPGPPGESMQCESLYFCLLYGANVNITNKSGHYPYASCNCTNPTQCKVLNYLAKVKILSNSTDEYCENFRDPEFVNYALQRVRPQSLQELNRLKSEKAGDIILYDFLFMKRAKVASVSKKPALKQKLSKLKAKAYPMFRDFLNVKWSQGHKRLHLIEKCKEQFQRLDCTVAELCVEKIFFYLNLQDLLNFNEISKLNL